MEKAPSVTEITGLRVIVTLRVRNDASAGWNSWLHLLQMANYNIQKLNQAP